MRAIDTTVDVTPHLVWLRAQGIRAVGRYYSQNAWKVLGREEALAVSRAGLGLFVVYQDRQNTILDFSRSRGQTAANRALEHAVDRIGQPRGSAVYFAVDFDADDAAVVSRIALFFDAVNRVFEDAGCDLAIGVYGSGLVCRWLLDAELARFGWLGRDTAWRGHRAFRASGSWAIAQGAGRATPFAHDLCEITGEPRGFGGFTIA